MSCAVFERILAIVKLTLQVAVLFVALVAIVNGETERVKVAEKQMQILELTMKQTEEIQALQHCVVHDESTEYRNDE